MTMRKRWWILGWVGTALFAAVFAAGMWYRSTADLDQAAARMRELGLASDLAEVADVEIRVESEVAMLVDADANAAGLILEEVFPSYDPGLDGDWYERTHPRHPAQEPLWVMTMAHGGVATARLRATAAALPDRPVRSGTPKDLRVGPEVFCGGPAVDALTSLAREEPDPEPDLVRAARVIAAQPVHMSLVSGLTAQRNRATVLKVLAGRWREVHRDGPLIRVLDAWRERDPRTMHAAGHELRVMLQAWRTLSPDEIAKAMNIIIIRSDSWIDAHLLDPWNARRGRAGAIVEVAEGIARGASTATWVAMVNRSEAARQGRWARCTDPVGALLPTGPSGAVWWTQRFEGRNRVLAALLIALIRGEPIPVDPTDPAGGSLRRHERDGELIGYYACGDDGIDNGGSREDWQFPFDRPWDPPAAP
ncbi:MAG: hypothetical protein RLZZ127_1544 [Planctomycetota bacterium]|jgi:hypothetical protein